MYTGDAGKLEDTMHAVRYASPFLLHDDHHIHLFKPHLFPIRWLCVDNHSTPTEVILKSLEVYASSVTSSWCTVFSEWNSQYRTDRIVKSSSTAAKLFSEGSSQSQAILHYKESRVWNSPLNNNVQRILAEMWRMDDLWMRLRPWSLW